MSTFKDLLPDVGDVDVARAVGIGLDPPGQEVGYRYPAGGIVNEILWDARCLHGQDEPHLGGAGVGVGLHTVDGNR